MNFKLFYVHAESKRFWFILNSANQFWLCLESYQANFRIHLFIYPEVDSAITYNSSQHCVHRSSQESVREDRRMAL